MFRKKNSTDLNNKDADDDADKHDFKEKIIAKKLSSFFLFL